MFVYATGYVTRWLELTNESQKTTVRIEMGEKDLEKCYATNVLLF